MKSLQMKLPRRVHNLWLPAALCCLSLALWTCKYPSGPLKENTPPHTRIANVPANDTTGQYIATFPEIQLSWVGDDPDGYIIAFQYRWSTALPHQPFPAAGPWTTLLNISKAGWDNVVLVKGTPASIYRIYNFLVTLTTTDTALDKIVGDSLATQRAFAVPYKTGIVPTDSIAGAPKLVLQTPTNGTFIFESPADSNMHRFQVRSVDNSDAVDPLPAEQTFWTLVSPGSIVIMSPPPGPAGVPLPNSMAIRHKTDRFPGLRFLYQASDPNNQFGFQFQWSVDDTLHFSDWSDDQVAYVTASDFRPIQSGTHVFYVRGKNRWGVVSPVLDTTFTAIVPAFDTPGWPHRTLIINDDVFDGNGTRGNPTLDQVESLYAEVMDSLGRTGRYRFWRVSRSLTQSVWPNLDSLGNYTSVLILMEYFIPAIGTHSSQRLGLGPQDSLKRYLNAGGDLIWSGTPNIPGGVARYNDFNLLSGTWSIDPFHILPNTPQSRYITSSGLDFNGVWGTLGYPDVQLDTNKIYPDSVNAVKYNIGNIGINYPLGFAQTISYFHSKNGTFLENFPVGVLFQAPHESDPGLQTYSIVYFGFPLYYVQKSAMIQCLRKAFDDIYEP